MLELLKRMRSRYSYDSWMILVDQAHDRKKLTEKEYKQLKAMKEN